MTTSIPYTLGLDIGMASVGAALLTESSILALHVRTFDKAETAKEGDSLNLIRRAARLTRRRIRRRAHRLLRLRRLFKRIGIVANAEVSGFTHIDASPWELRACGLDQKLEALEWAAVLYHIVKHRGFQSNRKSEAKADEKAGKMLSGVVANQQRLQKGAYRTVGEMAARHADYREAKRNKGGDYSHTFARSDLEQEVHLLFAAQRRFSNPYASEDIEKQVVDLLMARKPTLSGINLLKMVGRCTFEKNEFRAPKASYRAERFVWLGKLNNLKLVHDGTAQPLNDTERRLLMELPFQQAKLTFKQARKALGLPDSCRFNLVSYRFDPKGRDPEDTVFFEAKAFHAIRKAYEIVGLKSEWQCDSLDADRLDAIGYAMTCFKDDTEARDWLMEREFDLLLIESLLEELSFDKFIALSKKALCNLLPFMEQGQRYDEAAKSAGYDHSQTTSDTVRSRFLPAPDRSIIINPVVYRALNQSRKLVNAIVREYGPPAAVHIELARDLSKPFDERRKIEKEQKAFQEEKAQVRDQFIETFGTQPKALDLMKWRLYRQQNGQCAYSLKGLDANRLQEQGYAEIDHALPYSRSFDDSQNNKVLVLTVENRNKGNRTPYEYLDGASNSDRWLAFEAWVRTNKSFREAKRNRLLRKNFGIEEATEFKDRNLNDTRYICREFKRMVETNLQWHESASGKERCVVLPGQLTSLLRARWGLIKVREDGDLHHALDAAVIAATSRSLVKRMAEHSRRGELAQVRESYVDPETGEVLDIGALRRQEALKIEERFPQPWPYFREELLARLSPSPLTAFAGLPDIEVLDSVLPVRVSRAPTRRGLGAAHQETIRSVGRDNRLLNDGLSAIKTSLTSLTLKDLDNIVGAEDPRNMALIEVLRARLQQFGGNGQKAFDAKQPPVYKPSKPGKEAPIVRSVKLQTTQKSGLSVRGGLANNGNMLRVDVFTKGGKFHAVPLYVADAVKVELPNRAVVAYKSEEEWTVMDESFQFLFSLYPNDWVRVKLKDGIKEGYFSGLDRSTACISFWTHDRNQQIGKDGQWRSVGIKTAIAVEKCHVDLLGRLHTARYEQRMPLCPTKLAKGA